MGEATLRVFQDIIKCLIVDTNIATILHMLGHPFINVIVVTTIMALFTSVWVDFRHIKMVSKINSSSCNSFIVCLYIYVATMDLSLSKRDSGVFLQNGYGSYPSGTRPLRMTVTASSKVIPSANLRLYSRRMTSPGIAG